MQKIISGQSDSFFEQFYMTTHYSMMQDNDKILEAYVKSWTSGALDRAVGRGSVAFTLVLHHLASFIFVNPIGDRVTVRNKLVKSLLRDYSGKKQHQVQNFFPYSYLELAD